MTHRFLPTPLRRALEKAVKAARDVAEEGAADAVRRLSVAEPAAPGHLNDDAKALRRRLRAHARTLGDTVADGSAHDVRHLIEATGYAQWHRRLFARFLAERGLLRHPEHGPVSLEDCEELAKLEGFADAWTAAETYGARMLPGVFNPDDPVLALEFAPEHAHALRSLVDGLEPAIFQADDSLGWTYQFWRAAEKDRVNKAGGKIGADELPAVTQLFTEPYMVRFLLHNTLGAWRAGKILAARPDVAAEAADEDALRAAVALPGYDFDMLRFVKEGEDAPRWRPAAGVYPGWPTEAAKLTVLDPCCGSGHFLTEVLTILAGLRAEEDNLSPSAAVASVLRDNLFGLEIDGRCVQIAAFAVALTAWKIGGFQTLPSPHIAWVGAPPPLAKPEFVALANGDLDLHQGLDKLWDVFAHAPLLGSLIDPTGGDLMSPQRLGRIEPLLARLVSKTRAAEPDRAEGVIAARGMADAAGILGKVYTQVITNVPFLGRVRQDRELADFADKFYNNVKNDLAFIMLRRIINLTEANGTVCAVTPHSYLFMGTYKSFRSKILASSQFDWIARLGSGAFETISGEVVNITLSSITNASPQVAHRICGFDVSNCSDVSAKSSGLVDHAVSEFSQAGQGNNPDSVISFVDESDVQRLNSIARATQGMGTGDLPHYLRFFWEIKNKNHDWDLFQMVPSKSGFSGYTGLIKWENGQGDLSKIGTARKGLGIVGKRGVAMSVTGGMTWTHFLGTRFDCTIGALTAIAETHLPALTAYLSDPVFVADVRKVDQALSVTEASFLKVPFDLEHWEAVAAKKYPDGLPEPYSDDSTQWLFHGHPGQAETGTALHIALGRLAGYRWPAENDPDMHLSAEAHAWIAKAANLPDADDDGLLCLEAVAGEQPLANRLRAFLAAAFGEGWSDALERKLVADADLTLDKRAARDGSLEAWLRDRAFRQHCKLFHDRPFLWQVWDGTPDGFSAFVHYHRLDTATLSKLTYTLIGDWIGRMANAGDERRVERAKILQQKLTAILDGEAPLDIFVRWKPLEAQPIGWDPDLDDGVRLNIRPFIKAGVLRETPKIKWGIDRGKDVASAPWFPLDKGERNNDRHLTLAEKRAARVRAGS